MNMALKEQSGSDRKAVWTLILISNGSNAHAKASITWGPEVFRNQRPFWSSYMSRAQQGEVNAR